MNDAHLNLLWLDLESSGSDPQYDQIMEIGAFVTDYHLENISPTFHKIIKLEPQGFTRLMDNEYVRRMHEGNGLLIESMNSNTTLEQADESIHNFIQRYLKYVEKADKDLIRLAGSGVAAFDKPMIMEQMPLLAEHLIYSTLDVGHIRRFLKMMDVKIPDPEGDNKVHRALDDANLHLNEALYYREIIKRAL